MFDMEEKMNNRKKLFMMDHWDFLAVFHQIFAHQ